MNAESPEFNEFLQSYIKCALTLSTSEAGEQYLDEYLDQNFDRFTINAESQDRMRDECLAFATLYRSSIDVALHKKFGYTWSSVGCHFWLTRNGHSTGFSDHDLGTYAGYDIAVALTQACLIAGPRKLYIREDGHIGQSGHFARAA